MGTCSYVSILLYILTAVLAKDAQEWKSRIIYQILTDRFHNPSSNKYCAGYNYCGGTFQGIISKLDYIKRLGANAIWISPVVENTPGGFHGFWSKNINAINAHFGTADDLKQLVKRCHEKDIWVMVDVVANHMGYPTGCWWTLNCSKEATNNFKEFSPFNDPSHYHSNCEITNWKNQTEVEYCRLAGLPDLNESNPWVKDQLLQWIRNLVQTYGIDGIRVDTAAHMPGPFWKEFGDSAGVFQIGEVANQNASYVGRYQSYFSSVLNYPLYYTMYDVYNQRKSMRHLSRSLVEVKEKFKDPSVLGGFIDCHDTARFLYSNNDTTSLKNALVYTLMAEWIPIIYYGTEQGYNGGNDPLNRDSLWPNYNENHELYKFIVKLTTFRNYHKSSFTIRPQQEKIADESFYAFTRGEILVLTTNQGSGSIIERIISHLPHKDGQDLVNLFDLNDKITVMKGLVNAEIADGQPRVYAPRAMLNYLYNPSVIG